jgi:biopolymer transport protein ExbD
MRLTKRRRTTNPRINMTPMIDIVFLLIIFFMTVSQVSEVNRENLELPVQAGAEDQKPAVLTINFVQDGSMIVGGVTYDLPGVISLIADELARVNDDPTRLTVVLRGDRRGSSGAVNDVVEALTSMDIRKVRIPVQVPD